MKFSSAKPWLSGIFIFVFSVFCRAQQRAALQDSIHVDTLAAKAPEAGSLGHRFAYDMGSIYKGALFTFSGPARWGKQDAVIAGASVAGTGLLLLADNTVATYFREQGEKVPYGWHKAGWYMGKPQYNYAFTFGVYATGLIFKNEKIRRTGVVIITAATTGGLLQTVLKQVTGRARPGANAGHLTFDPFSKKEAYHSFPSGHAILSTTVFYALSKQFTNPWVKAGFYTAGLLTPVSRMWDNAHWITDVAVGAGISILCVESAEHFLKKNERYAADRVHDPHDKKISWSFSAGYKTIGLTGTF